MYGVRVNGNANLVRSCEVDGFDQDGIDVRGSGNEVIADGILIRDNKLKRCGAYVASIDDTDHAALGVKGSSNEIVDNTVQFATTVGIEVKGAGNLVAGDPAGRRLRSLSGGFRALAVRAPAARAR